MITYKEIRDLSDRELSVMAINIGLEKVKVKENFKEIMYKKYPKEYSSEDDDFFNRYAGKIVFAFPFIRNHKDDNWFILSDNNYCLIRECFETLAQH